MLVGGGTIAAGLAYWWHSSNVAAAEKKKIEDAAKAKIPLNTLMSHTDKPASAGELQVGNNYIVAAPFEAMDITGPIYRVFQIGEKISVNGRDGTGTTFIDPKLPGHSYATTANISASFSEETEGLTWNKGDFSAFKNLANQ